MMFGYKYVGEGGSKMIHKNWTVEGKNQTLGGLGGKKCPKKSDIIYVCAFT